MAKARGTIKRKANVAAPHGTLEDLAAASRILVDQGVFDAAGHVSMRHPGNPARFLMCARLHRSL